jgi:hypothetical protein
MLNNSTIVLIFVLLLIIYLFDNIKDLEDNLLNSPFVKKQSGKRKYFQEIELELPKPSKPINIESVKVKPQKDKTVKIETILSLDKYKPKKEENVIVHSLDKFITGETAPGSTTMVVEPPSKMERPLFVKDSPLLL